MQRSALFFLGALAAVSLVACGGSKGSSRTTSTAASPAAAPGSPAAAPGASPMMAAVPPKLNCGAVKPVWVNTHSHVYHEPGDPYYGHTKYGKYMCPSQAAAAGYHAAGGARHHRSKRSGGAMAQPSPSPSY